MSAPNGTLALPQLASTPSAPSPGSLLFYTKTDGNAYILNSSDVESAIGSTEAITALTGDVSAIGPGSVPATINFVGGQSASNVAAAVVLVDSATSSSSPHTLIERDASSNFSANIITATLNGNAATSTSSTTAINFTGTLVGDVTGTQGATVVSMVGGETASNVALSVMATQAATPANIASTLVERDASGNFAANVITANLTGNVSGSSSSFTGSLSGDVTGTQSATSIASSVVTGKLLTGLAPGTNTPILATNSILTALENLQAQVSGTSGSAITALTGDVSASGPGSAVATVNSVGGYSASAIATSVILTQAATAGDTPSTLALRDASGNIAFSTATLSKLNVVGGSNVVQATIQAWSTQTADILDVLNFSGSKLFSLDNSGDASFSGTLISSNFSGSSSGTNTGDVTLTNTNSIDLAFTSGQTGLNATLNLSADAADAGYMLANTSIHSGANPGLLVEVAYSTPVNIGTSNYSGSAASFALSDHVHAITSPIVLGLLLTGYTTGTNTPLTASNTFLQAFENLQAQINATTGAAITSLTGDVSATGPGASASTVAKIQGTTVSGTTGTGNVVFADAPTFSGNVNMGGFLINNLENPVSMQDAATKMYVDFLAQGIYPQNPIIIANLINDSLSTPPGSPVNFTTTYLIGSSPTGAWSSIGAGHFVYYDGSIWHDALGRAVQVGDRVSINISNTGTLGGNMVGEQNNIATVTNATPGSYAYTFAVPANRWLVLDNNPLSYDAGDTYYFNGTNWIEIATGFVTNPGIGLSVSGVTWNVNSDNSTIGINGSNQLYVPSDGITANQIANNTVTYGKLQNETASTLLGNPTGSSINPSEITLGSTLAFVGSILETDAMTGDVTSSANSFATTLSKIQGTAITGTTGTGNVVLSVSPTITGTLTATLMGNVTGNLTGNVTGNVSGSAASFTGSLLGDITGGQSSTYVSEIQGKTVSGTTGTGNVAFSASPTFTGTVSAAAVSISGQLASSDSSTTAVILNTTSFIFDTVNNALGIGIQPSTSATIDIINNSGSPKYLQQTSYSGGVGLRGRYANGTLSSPTNATAGQVLTYISGRGYGTTGFTAATTGSINIIAGESFSDSSAETYLTFTATPTGSVSASEHMRIAATGITLGPQSSSTDLHTANGGWIRTTKTITSTYTVDTTTTDDIILCNQSGAINIQLPVPTVGRTIVIKDISGNAQANSITLLQHASETIEGLAASKSLYTNYGSWTLSVGSAGNWWFV